MEEIEGKFDWACALKRVQIYSRALGQELEIEKSPPPYTIPSSMQKDYTFKRFKVGGDIIGSYITPDIIEVKTTRDESNLLVVVSTVEALSADNLKEKLKMLERGIFYTSKKTLNESNVIVESVKREGIPIKTNEDLKRNTYGDIDDLIKKKPLNSSFYY